MTREEIYQAFKKLEEMPINERPVIRASQLYLDRVDSNPENHLIKERKLIASLEKRFDQFMAPGMAMVEFADHIWILDERTEIERASDHARLPEDMPSIENPIPIKRDFGPILYKEPAPLLPPGLNGPMTIWARRRGMF